MRYGLYILKIYSLAPKLSMNCNVYIKSMSLEISCFTGNYLLYSTVEWTILLVFLELVWSLYQKWKLWFWIYFFRKKQTERKEKYKSILEMM